uniref:Collagen alpha-1(III) chain-like n=1 Tax=Castor canadensis TaxID=51338 RepID=A0A8B7TWN6_CASCN
MYPDKIHKPPSSQIIYKSTQFNVRHPVGRWQPQAPGRSGVHSPRGGANRAAAHRGRWCAAGRGPPGPPTPRARLSTVQRRPARDPLAPSTQTSQPHGGRCSLAAGPRSPSAPAQPTDPPGCRLSGASLPSPSAELPPSSLPPSAARSRGRGEGGGRRGMGGPAARRGARGLRALLLALLAAGTPAVAYNLDPQRPVRFQGPAGSFFGYAVLEHFHDNTRWVLVGAPKADSKYSASVKSPGAVFKCRIHTNPDRRCTELDMVRGKNRGTPCGKTCREDRDDEWMGVSLARQPKADGYVL